MLHSINQEQRLYVLPSGNGYSCLGFDFAEKRRVAVLEWLGEKPAPMATGTAEHFTAYEAAMSRGAAHNRATGRRCPAELDKRLAPFEGRRVEVTAPDGSRERFIVGKSMGWLPIFLEIERRDSSGGAGAYVPEGATVRAVAGGR